jgi:hypothetical protein
MNCVMAYNPIRNFYVNPGFAKGHLIQWKIDPAFTESLPYVFTVEISGTPDFSEVHYSIDAGDSLVAVDSTRHKQSFVDDHWYRLKFTTGDNNTYYSKGILLGNTMPNRRQWVTASEIMRKELLRMQKFTGGGISWLLKRKNFGAVTKATVDPVSGVPIADNTSDFGVGLVDGYFAPLKIFMSQEQVQQERKQDAAGNGVIETFIVDFRMIGYPTVEVHDVLVDGDDDRRFIVKSVDQTFFPGTDIVIIQQVKTWLIPNTDPVYDIVIDVKPQN